MFNKVFISYAKEDFETAKMLFDFLRLQHFDPWLDKKQLLPGQDWDYEIRSALKNADFIILLLSDISVAKRGYVQREFKLALDYCEEKLDSDIYIIPVKINDCKVPDKLSKYQWIELREPNSFELILNSLYLQKQKYAASGIVKFAIQFSPELNEASINTAILRSDNRYYSERLINATIQLISDDEATSLGAIYALHHFAKESEKLRKVIFDILCAYIRETTSVRYCSDNQNTTFKIQNILNLLFNDVNERTIYKQFHANLQNADLRSTSFLKANLKMANLNGCDLSSVNFEDADLSGASIIESNMSAANLINSNLSGVILNKSILIGANLFRSNLRGASIVEANLSNAILGKADLSKANLNLAVLIEANLYFSNLSEANLSKANLHRADLRKAEIREADLSGAEINEAYIERSNWISKLNESNCVGFEDIEMRFMIIEDKKSDWDKVYYRIKKR